MLVDFLASDPPHGVMVELEASTAVPGWSTTPEGPAFDAARRALAAGFEGRIAFETGAGLRMVVRRGGSTGGSVPENGPRAGEAAARDFEKILNLLESCAI